MSTTALVTFQEFEQLPDAPGKRELIDGEVIEIPPPKFRRMQISQMLYDLLRASTSGRRTFQEGGYRVAGGWVQPDVSVKHLEQPLERGYLKGAPALAVEVLSPSNTAGEIGRKLALYFSEGATEVWVVDPDKRSVMVYRRTGAEVRWLMVQESYSSPDFGVTIVLNELFDSLGDEISDQS